MSSNNAEPAGGKRKKKSGRKNLADRIGAMRLPIPDEVMQFYLASHGLQTRDSRVGRLMALSIEKKLETIIKTAARIGSESGGVDPIADKVVLNGELFKEALEKFEKGEKQKKTVQAAKD